PTATNMPNCAVPHFVRAPRATALRLRAALLSEGPRLMNARPLGRRINKDLLYGPNQIAVEAAHGLARDAHSARATSAAPSEASACALTVAVAWWPRGQTAFYGRGLRRGRTGTRIARSAWAAGQDSVLARTVGRLRRSRHSRGAAEIAEGTREKTGRRG